MISQDSPSPDNARRSQRVVVRIGVKVLHREDAGGIMSENTHTLVVNAHGALLPLAMMVRTGDPLILKHLMSSEEKQVRVVRVDEEQIIPREVAVEFTSPAPRFWHIDFPPADWELLENVDRLAPNSTP
jgi:hypothetical protein